MYLHRRSGGDRELAYQEHVRALASSRLRTACLVLAVVFVVDGAYQLLARPDAFAVSSGSRLAAIAVVAAVFALCRSGRGGRVVFPLAALVIVVTAVDVEMAVLATGGQSSMFFVGLILLAVASSLFFPFGPRAACAVSLAIAGVFFAPLALGWLAVDATLLGDQLFLFGCGTLVATVGAHVTSSLRRSEHASRAALEDEMELSDRLLLNVLPPAIANRLKAGEATIADRHREVSVLFADIVGFTPLSERIRPEELVALLNEVFSAFDDAAAALGLEKIKTIGDAYMVTGGLPEERPDHLEAMADLALEMLEVVAGINRRRGLDLTVRIGLNVGSVVAGVIGRTRFAYDVWGDTVNTASRMESHGAPGRIHVTEAVLRRLGDSFAFSPVREVEVKGKGTVATAFLLGRQPGPDEEREP